jgi:hypothetical protein
MVYKKVHRLLDADLLDADIAIAAAIAKSKISTSGTWAAADIPNLPASIVTSGFLLGARGGLEKELIGDFQNDYIVVYKTADGKFHMQSLGAPAAHNFLDAATHNNTLAGTPVRGDLIVANSTPAWARFAKGTANYFLVMGANDPAWTAFSDSLHGTRATVAQHPDVVGGASGVLTDTQHGTRTIANAHTWAHITKTVSSIADITTKDHDLLGGLGDDDHTQYLLVAGTRAMTGALRLALLSADPSLVDGMLLYRQDLDTLYFAYDPGTGVIKKQVMLEGLLSAEGVYFGNGFLDTMSPAEMTGVGNGTFTKRPTWGKITSGAVLNNQHAGYGEWGFAEDVDYSVFDASVGAQFGIWIRFTSVTAMNCWVIWGCVANTPDVNVRGFGIKIINGALYSWSGTTGGNSTTDLSTALSADTWYRIRVKRGSGGIIVWVNDVEKTTKTTDLPTGTSAVNSTVQVILKTTEAVDKTAYFRPIKLVHS